MINLKEGDTCLIFKDELERLNEGKEAKIFVEGKEFYLEVIKNE